MSHGNVQILKTLIFMFCISHFQSVVLGNVPFQLTFELYPKRFHWSLTNKFPDYVSMQPHPYIEHAMGYSQVFSGQMDANKSQKKKTNDL